MAAISQQLLHIVLGFESVMLFLIGLLTVFSAMAYRHHASSFSLNKIFLNIDSHSMFHLLHCLWCACQVAVAIITIYNVTKKFQSKSKTCTDIDIDLTSLHVMQFLSWPLYFSMWTLLLQFWWNTIQSVNASLGLGRRVSRISSTNSQRSNRSSIRLMRVGDWVRVSPIIRAANFVHLVSVVASLIVLADKRLADTSINAPQQTYNGTINWRPKSAFYVLVLGHGMWWLGLSFATGVVGFAMRRLLINIDTDVPSRIMVHVNIAFGACTIALFLEAAAEIYLVITVNQNNQLDNYFTTWQDCKVDPKDIRGPKLRIVSYVLYMLFIVMIPSLVPSYVSLYAMWRSGVSQMVDREDKIGEDEFVHKVVGGKKLAQADTADSWLQQMPETAAASPPKPGRQRMRSLSGIPSGGAVEMQSNPSAPVDPDDLFDAL